MHSGNSRKKQTRPLFGRRMRQLGQPGVEVGAYLGKKNNGH